MPALPIREKKLIERVRRMTSRTAIRAALRTGIGDDTAVLRLPAGHEALITTDFCLEGTHFRREWHPAEVAGHRCLTRGLSDVAAMGGDPIAVFLSLAVPSSLPQKWVDHFFAGLLKLARQFGLPLAGGDTAESPDGVLADIVVLGSVPKGQAVLRFGAQPGDGIYVTGVLGRSAMALETLRSGRKLLKQSPLYSAHFSPVPRLAVGRVLRQRRLASAMIDISDGLSTDLHHICDESRVGAVVYAEQVPRPPDVGGEPALRFALRGGEDYELLFTAHRQIPAKIAGVAVTRIGEITRERHVVLVDRHGHREPFKPQGWEHFAGSRRA